MNDTKAAEQNNRSVCYFCGSDGPMESHHIVPQRFGGSDDGINLVDLCPTCHSKLERLHDSRFYDELGVEKQNELQTTECMHDGCYARATMKIDIGETAIFYCDKHSRCSRFGCARKTTSMVQTEDGTYIPTCDEHHGCQYGNCGAQFELVAIEYGNDVRVVCEGHRQEML